MFDLDETLIHCNENANMQSDVVLQIAFPTGEVIQVHLINPIPKLIPLLLMLQAGINVRPHCVEMLQELCKYYELVVFTASHSCYANVVLDYLDPKNEYFSGRLFRENCVVTSDGMHIKDLRVI